MVKLRLIDMLIKSVPNVIEEKSYWTVKRGSTSSIGIYALQRLPRQIAHENASIYEIFSFSGIRKKMNANIKGLTKVGNIQAQCEYRLDFLTTEIICLGLGLLARPRSLCDPIASNTDITNYVDGIREPLQNYIHDEISLLESVCSSLYELEMTSSIISDKFESNLFVHIAATRLETVSNRIDSLNTQFKGIISKYRRPQIIERYWFPVVVTTLSTLWLHRRMTIPAFGKMIQTGIMNAFDTLHSFWDSWIVNPVLDILKTIRHKESKLAIMGSLSLASDLEVRINCEIVILFDTIVLGKNGCIFCRRSCKSFSCS
jgi:hypothetical protein